MNDIAVISRETGLTGKQVTAVVALLDQGATIPFIARYRKEKTGSLDEVAITLIRDRYQALGELTARKTAIFKSLDDRQLLTRKLEQAIRAAGTMTVLEDLYEKYRPRRRTRAMAAKEKGLAPLADFLLAQSHKDPAAEAAKYVDSGKGVDTIEHALAGARDIIAETVNEDPKVRSSVRRLFEKQGVLQSRVKKGQDKSGAKFKDYFDWSEPAFKAPSHRTLAMFRGSNEGVLTLHVLVDPEKAISMMERFYLKNHASLCRDQVQTAIQDAYKRLLGKSLEKECFQTLKLAADHQAIKVFTRNLKDLLLSPPLGEKRILAIDPGFRTGCKIVCLDAQGDLQHHGVIFPHTGERAREQAGRTIVDWVQQYKIAAVAVGNGTAGRETQAFVRGLPLPGFVEIVMVDESGASVYSASDIARQEFPDKDITVRGAVSIGRRLMDPLAELVKIDPKSIGVGQYQHDVDQKQLHQALDDTVKICVNQVGVEVNTASRELLARVAGLNDTIAAGLVRFRRENGPFLTRQSFLQVPRLGPKTFEQAAGFLRIRQGDNPLDASGIHPESYRVVERMARNQGCTPRDLIKNPVRIKQIDPDDYISDTLGMPTLMDILSELVQPGRDPRQPFQAFAFDPSVHKMEDLTPGMRLPGIVTNITAFGAFVDIGVHQDGLVHISQMADRFVKDPSDIVTVRQQVQVRVLDVDVPAKRISLSLKSDPKCRGTVSKNR
ncbi:MAG: RNA-binding transcriptional accessory protein [Desulfotignum sp.]|nr:RNA-binding transcriptional accessory protein [Desulfotignum sp.]